MTMHRVRHLAHEVHVLFGQRVPRSEQGSVKCRLGHVVLGLSVECDIKQGVWCLRCLLLVMCTYLFAKKALTLHLARGEGLERYFGCNLMQHKVLASSYQHLMAEAPQKSQSQWNQ